MDLRGMSGIVDVDRARQIAEVLPGTITMDLKDAVAAAGLYYPPDPTSEKESTIGGNVASNASGARTFRWGMTSDWLEGLEVVTGTGKTQRFFRRPVDKNTAGYRPFQDPVDIFPGSEGTLGIITRIWCRLMPDPGPFAAFILFYPSLLDALEQAVAFRAGRNSLSPRCCELFDGAALSLVGAHPKSPAIPAAAGAALYVEFDTNAEEMDRVIDRCLHPLRQHHVMLDDTVVAQTLGERQLIRELRHHVPESCNNEAKRFHGDGGLKVSTEFCVPVTRLVEMMSFVETTFREEKVDLLVRYGHVGNGHPHIFMRGRNPEEVAARKRLAHRWYEKAVLLGGTVSGEHGIGKTRRDVLRYMYSDETLTAMRNLKRAFDPHDILAMGNIFPETEPLVPEFFA
jgi:FAD/FMN-containing dehydrogenase